MPHSYTNLLHHIVFATKDRWPWLDAEFRGRVHEFLGAGIRKEGFGTSLIINGTADHVHILARVRPDRTVSEMMQKIKGNSSGWIGRTFRIADFHWQPGYSAFS